jgi:hypothetical protein
MMDIEGRDRAEIVKESHGAWPTLLDDGCDVVERCVECPLRCCRLDDQEWFYRAVQYTQYRTIVGVLNLYQNCFEEAADELSITVRTVFRAARYVNIFPDPPTHREVQVLAKLVEEKYRRWARHLFLSER